MTQNKHKYFAISTHVTMFGPKNLELNGKFGVIKFPLEPSDWQDITLHSPSLKHLLHFNYKIYYCYVRRDNACSFYFKIVLIFVCEEFCSEISQSIFAYQHFCLFCIWEVCLRLCDHIYIEYFLYWRRLIISK